MSAAAFFVQSCAAAVVDSRDMKQPLSVTPDAGNHQPTERPAKDGAEQAAGTTDFAVLSLPELLHLLHSSDQGLSTSDADAILQTVGPNRIDTAKPKRLLAEFIGRFRNPLVAILLGAAVVSAFTGDVPSFVIITVIVLGSVILDLAQECPRARENCLSDGCVWCETLVLRALSSELMRAPLNCLEQKKT